MVVKLKEDMSHAGDLRLVLLSDTDLSEEVHEARPEAPGFVAVTLQGADGHLSGPLGRDGDHEHCVVHQGCVRLQRRQWKEDVGILFHSTCVCVCVCLNS